MKNRVLAAEWRSGGDTIGIVAWQTDSPFEEWVATVGYAKNDSLNDDTQYIVEYGAKLKWNEAMVFFPQLDITKYKDYPKEAIKGEDEHKSEEEIV